MLPVTVRPVSLSFWRLKALQRYNRPIHRTCHPATFSYPPFEKIRQRTTF
nr:unnamed protein product [Callosobruchus chinensis]